MLLRPGWRQSWHDLEDVRIHAIEAGEAGRPLLILLHGFPEFGWAWRHQLTPLAEAGFDVVAPDLRGYNLSDAPVSIRDYRIERLVADVLGLADALGAKRFCLAGHDWGGIIAWAVAAGHPDRVKTLTIFAAPHPDLSLRNLVADPRQAWRSSYVAFFQLPWLPEALLRARSFVVLRRAFVGNRGQSVLEPGAAGHYAQAWSRTGALTAMLNYYRALRKGRRRWGRIAVPTRILWGGKDKYLGTHLAKQALDLCDRGELSIIEDASHWLHLERPEEVTSALLAQMRVPGQDRPR